MKTQTLNWLIASLLVTGCFAPEGEVETVGSSSEGSSGAQGSSSGGSPTTVGESTDTPTTGTPTTDGETGDTATTVTPTTDGETTDTPSTSGSSGGEDPFCGDGTIDPGEECDDGLDDNGLNESCLPDCNLNVCGDGNLGPDEACDDGEGGNVLEAGACAPDCSTVIEEKEIRLGGFGSGDLGGNPVAAADASCPAGFRALLSVPGQRQATMTAYQADALMDWPISPYTAYVNEFGDLVWITDDVPLWGVRDGGPVELENGIAGACGGNCISYLVVSGLRANWTNAPENCGVWSSAAEGLALGGASPYSVTDFLRDSDFGTSCDIPYFFTNLYCVEE